jgi:hypothetical protein
MQFILGVLVGIIVSTVGFTTIASYADQGVRAVQQTVKDVAQ